MLKIALPRSLKCEYAEHTKCKMKFTGFWNINTVHFWGQLAQEQEFAFLAALQVLYLRIILLLFGRNKSHDYFSQLKWKAEQELSWQDATFEDAEKCIIFCESFFKLWERHNSFYVSFSAIFIVVVFCCSSSRCSRNFESKLWKSRYQKGR